jgi:hypothetical protein
MALPRSTLKVTRRAPAARQSRGLRWPVSPFLTLQAPLEFHHLLVEIRPIAWKAGRFGHCSTWRYGPSSRRREAR